MLFVVRQSPFLEARSTFEKLMEVTHTVPWKSAVCLPTTFQTVSGAVWVPEAHLCASGVEWEGVVHANL